MTRRMILGVVLLMACACTPDGDPPPDAGVPEVACKNPPTDLAVQFTELQGSVVHWALSEGCIQTSYAPDMQEALPAFQAALSAWDSQACSDLCFTAPVVSTVSPDDFSQRRLHLVSGVPEGSDGQKAQAILTFRVSTGRIVQGVIYVNPHQPGTLSSGDWLAVVGRALGLGTAATGVDSVLSPQRPQPRTALTERDVESFCRLYGQPTFCGD